jgi:hypothetical protein
MKKYLSTNQKTGIRIIIRKAGILDVDGFCPAANNRLTRDHYTPREIYVKAQNENFFGSTSLHAILSQVLSRIPISYVDRILKENFILMPDIRHQLGSYTNRRHFKNKSIILLPEKLLEKKQLKSVIAHELAHAYLRHYSHYKEAARAAKEYCRHETEADRLIVKWGFKVLK